MGSGETWQWESGSEWQSLAGVPSDAGVEPPRSTLAETRMQTFHRLRPFAHPPSCLLGSPTNAGEQLRRASRTPPAPHGSPVCFRGLCSWSKVPVFLIFVKHGKVIWELGNKVASHAATSKEYNSRISITDICQVYLPGIFVIDILDYLSVIPV